MCVFFLTYWQHLVQLTRLSLKFFLDYPLLLFLTLYSQLFFLPSLLSAFCFFLSHKISQKLWFPKTKFWTTFLVCLFFSPNNIIPQIVNMYFCRWPLLWAPDPSKYPFDIKWVSNMHPAHNPSTQNDEPLLWLSVLPVRSVSESITIITQLWKIEMWNLYLIFSFLNSLPVYPPVLLFCL